MDILGNFSFELATRIEYGVGLCDSIGDILKDLGASRILIVTDPGIEKSGLLDGISARLKEKEIIFGVFDSVEPNPRDTNVEACARAARSLNADWLLAVGGGSPMDCAKAAAVLATHEGKIKDFEGVENIPGDALPLAAVPTTSGTGSEVTMSSVITDTSENYKFSIRNRKIAPRIALADPRMTATMPPSLTASTGMDALTHAIEAFTAKPANPLSDAAALYAVEMISRHLVNAFSRPGDISARAGMLLGSLIAGIAFSRSDVGSVHCIAESLGGMYDLPHGLCNAIMLPAVMEYNLDFCAERYARIASAMGEKYATDGEGAMKSVETVRRLAREVKLPPFRSLGISEDNFGLIAGNSVRNGSNQSNPRPMKESDYTNLLRSLRDE